MLKAKLLGATAGAESLAIEDVFSTYLYTGNSSTQTITNGIDLAGEGGLVWIKSRNNTTVHYLQDTERGANNVLTTTSTAAQTNLALSFSFDSSGFSQTNANASFNQAYNYASWTFRQAPRFFDVVTYTGNGGTARAISHDLGVAPGMVIVKRTNAAQSWHCLHKDANLLFLDTTDAAFSAATTATRFGDGTNVIRPNSTTFTVTGSINNSGDTYVAYLFAHDPLGPSGDGSDGLIACGSAVCDSNGFFTASVGFEPQWVLVKGATLTSNWQIVDTMRGMTVGTGYPTPNPGPGASLFPNTSGAETTSNYTAKPMTSGFEFFNGSSGQTYIYIAIRRGPMREPTVGTEVFSPNAVNVSTGTQITTGFPVDLQIFSLRTGTTNKNNVYDRLRGVSTNTTESGVRLITSSIAAEVSSGNETRGWDNTGFKMPSTFSSTSDVFWNFRRAPGFFDVVAYTGTGATPTVINHNLTVVPEMMIIKSRTSNEGWMVYHSALGNTSAMVIGTSAVLTGVSTWNSTTPSATTFTLGGGANNGSQSGQNYIAYLFASLPGISKVGSYTGNGSSQTINCGFTTGARFILIKRTDATGNWHVWDTDRGIVAANDPYLLLNSTAAEVTTNDSVDPDTSGFIVNQNATTNINVSSATYIFYAIA